MASPAFNPAGYVGGALVLAAGVAGNLLQLIQSQLEPSCAGTSVELRLEAEGGPIFIGARSRLGGPLTTSNWACQLAPGSIRIYRSTFPGSSTPLGHLQVLSTSAAILHVEVQS